MKRNIPCLPAAVGVVALLAATTPLFAHSGHDQNSFAVGFLHPITGVDHLLAMIAVGLLSARLAFNRMWALPLAFVAMMAAGGALGLVWASEGLVAFEWGIGLSVLVFGLVAAAAPRLPVAAGVGLVAVFAVCHGHAHVAEMGDAAASGYFPGMLLATALIHIAGLIVGLTLSRGIGEWSLRAAGAAVALVFAVMMVGGLM